MYQFSFNRTKHSISFNRICTFWKYLNWFNRWIDKFPINLNVSLNLVLSLSLIILLSLILSKKTSKNISTLLFLTILYFIVWVTSAPDFRFFHAISILALLIIGHTREYSAKFRVSFLHLKN